MSTSSKLSRRALVAGVSATVPLASVAALATQEPGTSDAELRRLWSEYLARADAHAAAEEKYKPARAAFDAELPPCPDDVLPGHHWAAHQWLWQKHGLDPLCDTQNEIDTKLHQTIAAILQTEAEGLFGIGVKLSALPADREYLDTSEYEDAIAAVLDNIDRLLGSDFAERFAEHDPEARSAHGELHQEFERQRQSNGKK
jgi:hypothetical protein